MSDPLVLKKKLTGERRWFDEARLGLFIHFGPYALRGVNENEFMSGGVKKAEYKKLRERFNPFRFDADEWASLAKDNGFRYVVLTAKHTDGFCMWDTRHTEFKITRTAFKRDLFGELAEACRRKGLRFGVYYSFGEAYYEEPGEGTPEARVYTDYVKAQYEELMTRYGRIDCLWHDAGDKRLSPEWVEKLTDWVHRVQPSCVVNTRGIGLRRQNRKADYTTPERYIPPVHGEHGPIECCDSIGQFAWGYCASEQYWSVPELVKRLGRVARFHGNYLLNAGPMPDGRFPPECVERMKGLGRWLRTNGESIFGTEACDLRPAEAFPYLLHDLKRADDLPAVGIATRSKNTVYLHLHDWPKGNTLLVRHLKGKVKRASVLGQRGALRAFEGRASRFGQERMKENPGQPGIVIAGLPAEPVDGCPAVIKLEMKPGMKIDEAALAQDRIRWVEDEPGEPLVLDAETAEFREVNGAPMVHAFKDDEGRKRFCWLGRMEEGIYWHIKVPKVGAYEVWLESEEVDGQGILLSVGKQALTYRCKSNDERLRRRFVGTLRLKKGACELRVGQLPEGKEGYFASFTKVVLKPKQ